MFDWVKNSNFNKKRKISKLRKWINELDTEMHEAVVHVKEGKKKHEIEQKYLSEIFMYYDEKSFLETEVFLSKNRGLPVVVPRRSEDSDYWTYSHSFGTYALSETGFANLDKLFHEARMRRSERFQSWFTPITSLVALFLSAIAIGAQVLSKEVPPSKEVVPPHSHDQ